MKTSTLIKKYLLGVFLLAIAAIFTPAGAITPTGASTAADYIAVGRAALMQHTGNGLQNADTAFASALQLDPANQEANVLKAATGLLLLPSQPDFQNLLPALGMVNTGTSSDIYGATYAPVQGENGKYAPPPGASTDMVLAYLNNSKFLPTVDAAIANLQKVTSPTFSIHLSALETSQQSVTVDYGDVKVAISFLNALKAFAALANSYNVSASLPQLANLDLMDMLNPEGVLKAFPSLFTFSTTDQRATAATYLINANTAYQAGSLFIRKTRAANPLQDNLIAFNDPVREQNKCAEYAAIAYSLGSGAILIPNSVQPELPNGLTINLAQAKTTTKPLRALLPKFDGNQILRSTWPDPTLAGIFPGQTQNSLNTLFDVQPALYAPYTFTTTATVTGTAATVAAPLPDMPPQTLQTWWYFGSPTADGGFYYVEFTSVPNMFGMQTTSSLKKVSSTGEVSTAVEDLGLNNLSNVSGIAVDGSGNVYIAGMEYDWMNTHAQFCIIKITPDGTRIYPGVFTGLFAEQGSDPVDGTGYDMMNPSNAATFSQPQGLAVDASGNLYVEDVNAIRKITLGTPADPNNMSGRVTTLAGKLGWNASNDYVDGPGATARFNFFNGNPVITVDANGNILVADGGNLVRKITSAGVVSTVAGNVNSSEYYDDVFPLKSAFAEITGMAVDASGNIYVSDSGSNTIRRIAANGAVTTLAGANRPGQILDGTGAAARFSSPGGIAVGSKGELFVQDFDEWNEDGFSATIRKGVPATSADIVLGNLEAAYDGTPKPVVAVSNPAGADITLTYNGQSTVPTTPGVYSVVATVGGNYPGSTSGELFIDKGFNTITFGALPAKAVGNASFALTATASSKLPVTYKSSNPEVATVSGSMVTLVGTGTTTLTASQAGNDNYYPATDVAQTLTVAASPLANIQSLQNGSTLPSGPITFTWDAGTGVTQNSLWVGTTAGGQDLFGGVVTGGSKTLSNLPSDGRTVYVRLYSVINGVSQYNSYTYTAYTKLANAISFGALPTQAVGNAPLVLSATASSGLPVSYTSSNPAVAAVNGSTVTIVAPGATVLTASQAGDNNYKAATSVTQTLTVTKGSATVSLNNSGTNYAYDGTVKAANVTTLPPNLPVSVTYNGIATAPSVVGSYTVVATVNTASYSGTATGTLSIYKQGSGITFGALPGNKVYGNPAFVLTGSASSGLPVSYISSNLAVATVSGNTVTIVGSGSATITASQAGNGNWLAATSVSQPLVVGKAAATVTLGNLSQLYTGTAKTVTATVAPAGQPVTVTYNGTTAAPSDAGSYAVVATVNSANYQCTTSGTLNITKAANAITFGLLPTKAVGDAAFALTGTASSKLPVTYTSSNPAVATIDGNMVTIVGTGTAVITASQAGNGNYNAAANVTQPLAVYRIARMISPTAPCTFGPGPVTFTWDTGVGATQNSLWVGTVAGGYDLFGGVVTGGSKTLNNLPTDGRNVYVRLTSVVNGMSLSTSYTYTAYTKLANAISFGALPGKAFGDAAFALTGTASSGLPVSYTSSNPVVARVSGSTVTIVAPGTAVLTASQAGDSSYKAATSVAQTLTVTKGSATVSLNNSGAAYPYDGTVKAANVTTIPSGLPVSVTYNGTTVAPSASGTYAVVATVNTASYSGTATGTLTINKADNAITFGALPGKTYGNAAFALTGTASSKLPVTYTSSNPAVATISYGYVVTLVGSGTTTITASQAGNANYNAAPSVSQPLVVGKAAATVTLSNLSQPYTGTAKTATVTTVPAGLPVTVTYNGQAGGPTNAGNYEVVAMINDARYSGMAANLFTIGKIANVITFGALPGKVVGDAPFALAATASSKLPVTYTSSNPAVATVSGSLVTVVGSGTTAITASQAGNGNYNAATNVTQPLVVRQLAQMLTPAAGSTLASGTATFTWDAGYGASAYSLWVGTSAGTYNLFGAAVTGGSKTLTNLPTDGRTVYVRLYSVINGVSQYNSYTYTASGGTMIVTTLAGSAGVTGSDDGTGTAARFDQPEGVAVDANGNVYVSDTGNNTIRKIMPGGTVITLAGSPGVSGTANGTGSAAQFNQPEASAADANGNLYVADMGNHTIRKITPAGVVTTLAGSPGVSGSANGTGSAAQFSYPHGVAVDGSGNVYVTDSGNHTIRKITPAGVVTTLAGSPGGFGSADGTGSAARFANPYGVAVDASGNVYVANSSNSTIRKITPAGVVTTLAGSAGNVGSADGTGSAARFQFPTCVAVDGSGNVYVADSGNNTLRKITPAGVVTTLAGNATAQPGSADGTGSAARFSFPEGVGVVSGSGGGTLYVADMGNSTIRKITFGAPSAFKAQMVTLGALTSGTATFTWDAGVGGSEYKLNIGSTAGGSDLFAKSEGTALTETVTNLPTDGRTLYVTLYSKINGVWQTNSYTYTAVSAPVVQTVTVTTLVGSAGAVGSADGTGSAARFDMPNSVAVDGSGNVYVADCDNHTIRKITPDGLVTTLAGTPGSQGNADGTGGAAQFSFPRGIAVDGNGNVYVADTGNGTIRKITPAGVVTTLAGSAAAEPGSADGTGSAARFNWPCDVTVDASGNVYVADTGNRTIRKITPDGMVATLAGSAGMGNAGSDDGTGSAARFNYPNGVAVDANGNVYVADTDNSTIRKITPAGVVTTLAGSAGATGSDDGTGSAARFNYPYSVAVDASGNVYVADTDNSTIRKITPAGVVTTLAGSAGATGSDDGTGSAARFNWPDGVAVDASGNVHVADTDNQTIRKITFSAK